MLQNKFSDVYFRKMIYTLTLNPSLDRTIYIERLARDDKNIILHEEYYAGGKGIDVSRVIKALGGQTVIMGLSGGYDGAYLEGILINEGLTIDFVRTAGNTRTNIIIHCVSTKEQFSINAPGPVISPSELGILYDKLMRLSPKPSFFVASGSVPRGVSSEVYKQLGSPLSSAGVKVVVDTDGDALRSAISIPPFMVKPNIHELERLAGHRLSGIDDVVREAKRLVEMGIKYVVVSMGKKGLVVAGENELFRVIPPEVQVVTTTGAGDATVAGIIFSLDKGESIKEAARFGAACGTATTISPGTATMRREDVKRIIGEVVVQEL